MALPSQVTQQGKAADDALKTINTPPGEIQEQQTKPVENDADTVEGLQAQIAELQDKLKKSEQRYSVLQGKYNAEIDPIKKDVNTLNNLKAQVKNLEKEVSESKRKVAELVTSNAEFVRKNQELQTQLANKKVETPEADTVDVSKLLSEEDREALEAYGIDDSEGFIGIISKLLNKTTPSNTAKETTSEPAKPEKPSEEASVVDSFWIGLEDAIPDWQKINRSAEFLEWLEEMAPYSDKSKRQILLDAQNVLNLKTVINIFEDFKATDKYKPEQDPVTNQETPPQETKPEKTLEDEVEPDRSQNVDIQLNQQPGNDYEKMLDPKYQFKTSEITAFYKDATQSGGLFHTNPELYAKIDKAIVQADPEGRVIKNS